MLDLACGAGVVTAAVAQKISSVGRIIAVDLSTPMLKRAKAMLQSDELPGGVAQMDAQGLALPDRSFDVVGSGLALGSFPNPSRALEEIHRILRSGGLLGVCIAPVWWWEDDPRWSWHEELISLLGVPMGNPSIHTEDSLRSAIEAAGFRRVSTSSECFDLRFVDAQEFWAWVWSHGSRQFLEALGPERLERYKGAAFEHIGTKGIDGRMFALLATGDAGALHDSSIARDRSQ